MGANSRPADPATFAAYDCEHCDWGVLGQGDGVAPQLLLLAAEHVTTTGHVITTMTLAEASSDADDVLRQLLPERAVAFGGGYAIAKGDHGG